MGIGRTLVGRRILTWRGPLQLQLYVDETTAHAGCRPIVGGRRGRVRLDSPPDTRQLAPTERCDARVPLGARKITRIHFDLNYRSSASRFGCTRVRRPQRALRAAYSAPVGPA